LDGFDQTADVSGSFAPPLIVASTAPPGCLVRVRSSCLNVSRVSINQLLLGYLTAYDRALRGGHGAGIAISQYKETDQRCVGSFDNFAPLLNCG